MHLVSSELCYQSFADMISTGKYSRGVNSLTVPQGDKISFPCPLEKPFLSLSPLSCPVLGKERPTWVAFPRSGNLSSARWLGWGPGKECSRSWGFVNWGIFLGFLRGIFLGFLNYQLKTHIKQQNRPQLYEPYMLQPFFFK